ncbi:MAG: YkgJ family cysteine cluster protein [Hyphomicrobiales bacterium]
MKPSPTQRSSCLRCGTCCRKGGPALHVEDRDLVVQGVIHTRHLYTIRKGELARDPASGDLIRVEGDIIKIKGRGDSWACRFLDEDANACRIYAHRPLECRHLECWDTSRFKQIYGTGRLSRKDLLADVQGLWELIEDHERRCDYDRTHQRPKCPPGPGAAEINRVAAEITRYDAELRRLMVTQGGLEPEMLDFLLGRPVDTVLRLNSSVSSSGS